ncbi:hypothetical protein LEP1GSC161_1040 [Leptospira santarosai str. CBC1416]|uniref:Uncharacterized protein n=1 Tax=Leptospira santarosai str. CBC1416 TaxID=1193059 RepID=M6VVE8_9LEPT|nr:hypothetical protein LEP1GSC161_1040 [Leptospira santarosai str. CBC1416]
MDFIRKFDFRIITFGFYKGAHNNKNSGHWIFFVLFWHFFKSRLVI